MSSQPIVQRNYIIYFNIRGFSFNNFLHQYFWKRVHNSKEMLNLQGLFVVLTVGYVDMTIYPLTKYYYIIEKLYFIYKFFILFISTFSFLLFLYTVSWRYKRDCLHANKEYRYFVLHNVLCY